MNKVNMSVMHDPDNGVYGDCQRACIASLLEIDLKDIPHFYVTDNDDDFFYSLNSYLAAKGLFHLETTTIDFSLPQFKGMCNVYHLIYGKTIRGTQHATVGLNGVIIHDPHPSKVGLDVDFKDEWTYAFIVNSLMKPD